MKVIVKYTISDCVGNTFNMRCIHCEEVYRKHVGSKDSQRFQCCEPSLPSPRYLEWKYGEFQSINYPVPEWCPLERSEK